MLRERHHLQRSFLHSDFFKFWRNQYRAIRTYWTLYGGASALIRSPYFQISLLLTLFCFVIKDPKSSAADVAVSVLPNLLGFTVGAMAIVLAFSSAEIFISLAEEGEPQSFFMKLTANLVHFIGVQVTALLTGIVAKLIGLATLDFIAMFLLFYAVSVTFSAGLQLFQTAMIYNAQASLAAKAKKQIVRRRQYWVRHKRTPRRRSHVWNKS